MKKSHPEQRNNLTFSVTSFEALIHFHFIPLNLPLFVLKINYYINTEESGSLLVAAILSSFIRGT